MNDLRSLADLLAERNSIDERIATLLGRPAERSHIGEFIARRAFEISEPDSATQTSNDGMFSSRTLTWKTVNIKFYGKDDGIWDIKAYPSVDFYLVMCGRKEAPGTSRGKKRPLQISAVYLIPEHALLSQGVKPRIATSVRQSIRDSYRIFPSAGDLAVVTLTDEQRSAITLFG